MECQYCEQGAHAGSCIGRWSKETVQKWFKDKGWEDWGQPFVQANGNALVALPKEYFTRTLGVGLPGEAVYAAIQEEKNRGTGT